MSISRFKQGGAYAVAVVFACSIFAIAGLGSAVNAVSDNDIISGGVRNETELQNSLDNGDGVNSASNIQGIFNEAIGVSNSSDFTDMESGYVFRDGRVSIRGETVATDAHSTGRQNFRDSRPLGDSGAYVHRTDVRFSTGTDKLRAFIKRNSNGEYMYAVLKHCGNPVIAKPIPVKVVTKEVEKEVIVERPVVREVIVEKPVEKEVVVERPVERVVAKEEPAPAPAPEPVPERLPRVGTANGSAGIVAGVFAVTALAGGVSHRIFSAFRGY